jgi:hypothetical protein
MRNGGRGTRHRRDAEHGVERGCIHSGLRATLTAAQDQHALTNSTARCLQRRIKPISARTAHASAGSESSTGHDAPHCRVTAGDEVVREHRHLVVSEVVEIRHTTWDRLRAVLVRVLEYAERGKHTGRCTLVLVRAVDGFDGCDDIRP